MVTCGVLLARGIGAEHGNGAGPVHLGHAVGHGRFEHDEQAVHVQLPAKERVLFGRGREQGGEVVNLLGPVLPNELVEARAVEHVEQLEGAAGQQFGVFGRAHVGGYHQVGLVALAQGGHQLQAKLAAGANDQHGAG